MSGPSRRSLLGSLAVVAAVPDAASLPLATVPAPDAELLSLCATHAEVWVEIDLMNEGAPHTDEGMEEASDEWAELSDEIAAIAPTAAAGLSAKAAVAQLMIEGYNPDSCPSADRRLVNALLADLVRVNGGAA